MVGHSEVLGGRANAGDVVGVEEIAVYHCAGCTSL